MQNKYGNVEVDRFTVLCMNASILPPTVEYCLVECGIVVQDFEWGWLTACENQDQGLGYIYFMKNQSDYPDTDAISDVILPATDLRKRIASAITQGCNIHLG